MYYDYLNCLINTDYILLEKDQIKFKIIKIRTDPITLDCLQGFLTVLEKIRKVLNFLSKSQKITYVYIKQFHKENAEALNLKSNYLEIYNHLPPPLVENLNSAFVCLFITLHLFFLTLLFSAVLHSQHNLSRKYRVST